MKKIGYTQRVEVIESYGERRDCADQKIPAFLSACGFLPVPIMNNPSVVGAFCKEIDMDGIFLSGGNDLCSYGGDAPERDETERALLDYAIERDIPVFGICRGMQLIADYFGASLESVDGHIGTEHRIRGLINRELVNSYHGMGLRQLPAGLEELSHADDGIIEAMKHRDYRILGIMWHPERVKVFCSKDIQLISNFFN